MDARGPDPAGELEDEESVEDQVEKEEEEEGEVEEEEEGEELVQTARLLQVGMEGERLVSKLLNEQSDKEKYEREAKRDPGSPLTFPQLSGLSVRLVLAERVLQRADVERSPDALAHRGQAEEHGKRPILDHQAQEDANPLNSFCCVKLTDQDEEEGDKGADEEGHLELGEVVPPQLFYEQVEKNEGKEGEEAENEEDNLDVSLSSRVVLLLTEVEAVAFVWFQKN